MINLVSWVRSRLQPSVEGIWCVHCRVRQTVRQVEIKEVQTSKRLVRLLIGECRECSGPTATFVS